MKKIYSTLTMLAMMVAAFGFTACGGDDEDVNNGGGDSSYVEQYFRVFINGEPQDYEYWGSDYFAYWDTYSYHGADVYYYGGIADHIMISYQDAMNLAIYAGFVSKDLQTLFPKSEGSYDITIRKTQDDYFDETVGMNITGGNMKNRTVTSGSLIIKKVFKCKSPLASTVYGREDGYATEGTFSFTLMDNWDGNENEVSGEFRIVF